MYAATLRGYRFREPPPSGGKADGSRTAFGERAANQARLLKARYPEGRTAWVGGRGAFVRPRHEGGRRTAVGRHRTNNPASALAACRGGSGRHRFCRKWQGSTVALEGGE